MIKLNIFRSPDPAGSGGGAPAGGSGGAPAGGGGGASSSSAPASAGGAPQGGGQGSSASTGSGAGGAGEGAKTPAPGAPGSPSSPAGSAGGAGAEKFVSALDGMPQRGTTEYQKAFAALPLEKQQAIENEIADRELNPDKYAELDKDGKPVPKPGEEPKADDGAKPEWEADPTKLFLTEEEAAALPPKAAAVLKAMQGHIDTIAPYLEGGKFQKGLETMANDPIIKQRMAALAGQEDPFAMPSSVEAKFNPNSFVKKGELEKLDFVAKPEQARQQLSDMLLRAYEAGSKETRVLSEYEKAQSVATERRVRIFDRQLNDLMVKNPSLKSDKPFSDKSHPLHGYISWANENLGDVWLEKHGQAAGYAAYLQVTGGFDKTLESVAQQTSLRFIRALENGDKQVALAGRGNSAPPAPAKTIAGIDLVKYKADMGYRRTAFSQAAPDVRKKLEVYISTGVIE